ncbi:hypothetical protein JCM33374_g5251 [Metschnikowia sp. JCM 33374]|nr:hypothetical protein JCM33374_g5251 [Metschnikowia sp. JCM 33374]
MFSNKILLLLSSIASSSLTPWDSIYQHRFFPADVHELSDHFEHGLHVDASACDGPIKDTPTEYDEIELSVTESQYSAIVHPPEMNQILRIRAGPGSGKTFTLVARIAHLLSNGTPPESILVLSMANRSVDSLKDTLSRFIGSEKAAAVEISTFHSFCAGLLEQYGSIMNARYTKQNIFDETTWKTMIGFFSGKS